MVAGAGMGYCPFSKIELKYSGLYCGTQQAEEAHNKLSRHTAGLGAPGGERDTAGHNHDTADRARDTAEDACNTTRSAHAVWPGEDAVIQSLYRELGGPWVAI